MDPLVTDYFAHLDNRLAHAGHISDMPTLARELGYRYTEGRFSVAAPGLGIQVARHQPAILRRAEAAHELAHVLADEQMFTQRFRYYHASAPDIDAHIEELTEHGADRLLMPDDLVQEIIHACGNTAQAVWELSIFAWVPLENALRRVVHLREGEGRAGFIASGSYVQTAEANGYSPFWPGDRLPEPHIAYESGISLFEVPRRPRQLIGLLHLD